MDTSGQTPLVKKAGIFMRDIFCEFVRSFTGMLAPLTVIVLMVMVSVYFCLKELHSYDQPQASGQQAAPHNESTRSTPPTNPPKPGVGIGAETTAAPEAVEDRVRALEKDNATQQEKLEEMENDLKERKWDEFITAMFTLILGMGAFFFTWMAVSEYQKRIREEARKAVVAGNTETNNFIAARVEAVLALLFGRLSRDSNKGYDLRDGFDFQEEAIGGLRRAIESLNKCNLPRDEIERYLPAYVNNFVFYQSLRGNDLDAEEALKNANDLAAFKGFNTKPIHMNTYIRAYLTYYWRFDLEAKKAKRAELQRFLDRVRALVKSNDQKAKKSLDEADRLQLLLNERYPAQTTMSSSAIFRFIRKLFR